MKPDLLFLSLLLPLAVLAAACTTETKDQGQGNPAAAGNVESSVRSAADAWNNKDLDRFLVGWTDNGLKQEFGVTHEEAGEALSPRMGELNIDVRKMSNTNVNGNTATTDAEFIFGSTVQPERLSLVKEGDAWKIDGTEPLRAEVPGGVTAVDVKMSEFTFGFDRSSITDGNVAFRVENIGMQPHELVLIKIDEDFDLQKALQSPGEPEGLEFVGAIGPLETGEQNNLVFARKLQLGRYAMVCFMPDINDQQQHTPHLLKGMIVEFAVE